MTRQTPLRTIALLLSCLGLAVAGNRRALAEPIFAGATFEIGPAATRLAVGDMNGDGIPDLVTTDGLAARISVLISRGDGTFEPARFTTLNVAPLGIALNDLDLDGDLDLVMTVGGGIGTALNHGDGYFDPVLRFDLPGASQAFSLAIADFNGDDSVDVAFSELSTASVYVYLSRGGYGLWDVRKVAAGRHPEALVAGDFDGDGKVDLAAENFCATGDVGCSQGEIAVVLGHGDGSFAPPVLYAAGPRPATTLRTGDFNADGIPDLATANAGTVSVLFGAGNGSFRDRVPFNANTDPFDLVVADFNRDRIDDIAFVSRERFGVVLGRQDENLQSTPPAATGGLPLAFGAADFNADGEVDLVINHRTPTLGYDPGYASIYLGHGDGTFGQRALTTEKHPGALVDADLNEDGRPDLVVPLKETAGVAIFLNQGSENFLAAGTVPAGNGPTSALVSDFNGDGHSDVAVANGVSNDVSILLGDGAGHLVPAPRPHVGSTPSSIAAGDFNEDGVVDLAVTNSFFDYLGTTGGVSILIGVGDGTFAPESRISVNVGPHSVVVADFNRDGHADLAVASTDGFTAGIYLLLGRGDGTFATGATLTAIGIPGSLVTGDLNGDTLPDLVYSSTGSNSIQAYLGQGDGDFLPAGPIMFFEEAASVVLADFDGDGRLDLAARSALQFPFYDKVLVLRGGGDGTFSPVSRFAAGAGPVAMIARDLDGDGRTDLAVAGGGVTYNDFGTVTLLFNQHPGPDADHDGIPDASDPCTDTDGDGFGDPGFPANTCPADNCPHVANPDQANGDHDALGDACDACTDSDHDGLGDAGYPQNLCAPDNCPAAVNPFQGDADHDGAGDACDTCTDPDGDGFGSRGRVFPMTCPIDNCGNVYNPGQEDADGDGAGDVCDPCPHDAANDYDRDGLCGDVDNCPLWPNPSQADQDHDGRGDACDNCPTVPNPDQADGNQDGAGDACQPSVRIYAVRHTGSDLEAIATVQDPQGETLNGSVQVFETKTVSRTLPDMGTTRSCDDAIFPENIPFEGIGFAYGSIGFPVLFDYRLGVESFGLICAEGTARYFIGRGSCDAVSGYDTALDLEGLALPAPICLIKSGFGDQRFDATVLAYDTGSISMTVQQKLTLTFPFTGALPARIDLPVFPWAANTASASPRPTGTRRR